MLTQDVVVALGILAIAVTLFVTEKLRADLVGMLVLLALALTGLLNPEQALSGFSHSAVVTVIGVFVISEGLFETGVAQIIGQYVTRIAGRSEMRLMVTIMLAVAGVSAVMNNVGATAVLLPVVVGLAKRNNIRPSKLLIPLSFGALQGGLLTLIGRPSNIIVSDALEKATGQPFGFFGFTHHRADIAGRRGVLYVVDRSQALARTSSGGQARGNAGRSAQGARAVSLG